MIDRWGGAANFELLGWVPDVSDFYARCSLYVQPSVTEGFGIEVLEAMAHGRTVLCSTGAGSADVVDPSALFPPCDAAALAEKIRQARFVFDHSIYPLKEGRPVNDPAFPTGKLDLTAVGKFNREKAAAYTWDKVREQYKQLWRGMLK
jgi:glycosyltransferase involved in cell wall biosynthesis